MTKTKRMLDLLAQGSQTMESLAEATGMEIEQVRRSIWNMRFLGYIETKPETYVLSAKGTVRQMTKTKTPKAVIDKKIARRRERREESSAGIVANAMRNVPSSVFQLGGMQL
jgi:hypothetical protein